MEPRGKRNPIGIIKLKAALKNFLREKKTLIVKT